MGPNANWASELGIKRVFVAHLERPFPSGATPSRPDSTPPPPSSEAEESSVNPCLAYARLHIHVQSADGEAKFWIEPQIKLARNHQLSAQDLSHVLQLVVDHEQEIRDAWRSHFGS